MREGKIFGIGFSKTGTTSLEQALGMLGYRVCGPRGVDDPNIATNVSAIIDEALPQYDAFLDNPWPVVYQELDRKCRNSKFILTVRPTESWIGSVAKYFGKAPPTPMREWIYGVADPRGFEGTFVRLYERHNAEVREYFKDRPGDFLEMRITEGEGWEALCPFLGKDIPDAPFPHRNPGYTHDRWRTLLAALRKRWRRLLSAA